MSDISTLNLSDDLKAAMADVLARHSWHADGEASYQDSVRTNRAYRAEDVESYIMARIAGDPRCRPRSVSLDPREAGYQSL
jgi:hypothetical protein